MVDLENLLIYKEYVELICFTIDILMKYPKEVNIQEDIKKVTYDGLNMLIHAHQEENLENKEILLGQLDASLKTLKVLVRISNKKKYINSRTVKVWNKKIINLSNLTWTWMKSCQSRNSIFNN